METYRLTSAQDNITGEYRQVEYRHMEQEALRLTQLWLWVAITFGAAAAFVYLARNFGKLPAGFKIGTAEIIIGLAGFVATLAVHEWVHALVMRMYGARPEFGMFRNKLVAYTIAPGYGLRRNAYILVALTPLIVLTSLALLGIWIAQGTVWVALFAWIAVVNAGGAVTDLWVIAIVLRYPSCAWTVDDRDGMRILMPLEG